MGAHGRSPFLDLPGAVAVADAGVSREAEPATGAWRGPLHYGGFLREQRELAAGRAIVDLDGLGVLRLEGADRRSWLDSLSSQLVRELAPGSSAETLILSPEGRIEHAIAVLADRDDEALWLLVEPGAAETLRAWLERMRFRLDVRLADASEGLHPVAWLAVDAGPAGDATPAGRAVAAIAPDAPVWADPWGDPPAWATSYRMPGAAEPAPWPLRVALLDEAQHASLAAALADGGSEIRPAGLLALEALRIAAWRPRAGAEVDARAIPHELDWLRSAVHLAKGCYRGQETIAKVHNLGRPPRRLALVHLDGSLGELPEAGSLLTVRGETKPVGRITSAAIHHEDGPIALAILKRSLPLDAALEVPLPGGGVAAAAATPIVSPEAGRTVDVPRLRRLGAPER